jgi:hypothetical protein
MPCQDVADTHKPSPPTASHGRHGRSEPEAPLSSSCRGPTARGRVSRQEFMNFMAAEFDRLDENKDGEPPIRELVASGRAGFGGIELRCSSCGFFRSAGA